MDMPEFDFEFHHDLPYLTDESIGELRTEAESRLRRLAAEHTDMIGAAVTVERMAGGQTPHMYRAQAVVYIRPSNLAGEAKGDDLEATLRDALDAVERQIRKRRSKFRETWKKP